MKAACTHGVPVDVEQLDLFGASLTPSRVGLTWIAVAVRGHGDHETEVLQLHGSVRDINRHRAAQAACREALRVARSGCRAHGWHVEISDGHAVTVRYLRVYRGPRVELY